jgi:opacity protein-like surface antigen
MKVFPTLLLFACGTVASRAQTNSNFYLKADSGAVFQPNLSYDIQGHHGELSVDPGVRVDFAGGYRFTDWCAGELETGVVYAGLNFPGFSKRDYFQVPVLANCILTYPNCKWKPFIGGGAGIVEVILNPRMDASLMENQTTFGCQAVAGFTYPITRRLDFGVNYKFLYYSQFTIHSPSNLPNAEMGPGMSHSIAAAFVFHF